MATQLSSPLYQAVLDAFDGHPAADRNGEPDFLVAARQQAMAHFREMGFPTTRVEDWKYTNLGPFLREGYQVDGLAEDTLPPAPALLAAATVPGLECYQVVLRNGRYLADTGAPLPPFVKVRRLSEARQDPAFQEYFGRQTNVARHPFAALNTALFQEGLLIEVEAHAHPDKPLHLVHTYTGTANRLVQPRHLVVVHPQASLSLIESVATDSGGHRILVNSVTEVEVAGNARVDHYLLQAAQPGLLQIQHTEVCQRRDSVYSSYTFSLPGAELLRNNLHVNLAEANTESHLYGFYLAAEHQLVDNHTVMNHRMPHCESNEVYKGVLLDTAIGVFNGKVLVQPDAQKTNAFQQNNNLLLSPRAVIYSKPQLEIYADDVKCSHGSTTGQLNPEALFYLRSRGISEAGARALLVQAFAFDVTDQVKIPKLKGYINQLITRHLPVDQEMVKA
jgi:Fe-S cluster assembly protein SufD